MTLSKRLEVVATFVDLDKRVIDVGCDHAYLDIYLTLYNGNKCIATDINPNALNIAKENIKKYNLSSKIETILSDGLTSVEVCDDDNIVICGMGTYTILNILKTNKLSNTLIISSNNNIDILRREVIKMGYYIDSEVFVVDKNKPYIIIKFIKGLKKYKKMDYVLGPILKYNKTYIKYLIEKYNQILKNIGKNKFILRLRYKFMILILKRYL